MGELTESTQLAEIDMSRPSDHSHLTLRSPNEKSFHEYRELRVATAASADMVGVAREGILEDGRLTAVERHREVIEVRDSPQGKVRVTRDNPFVDETDLLDERGVIREGAVVGPDSVLVSAVTILPTARRKLKSGRQPVSNKCFTPAARLIGATVVRVVHESAAGQRHRFPVGLQHRISIDFERECPLEVGDFVNVSGEEVLVARIMNVADMPADSHGPADLVVCPETAARIGIEPDKIADVRVSRSHPPISDATSVRTTGSYSLITQMPLRGQRSFRTALVTLPQVEWLMNRGMKHIVGEFTSLKSNDLTNRAALTAFAKGEADSLEVLPASPLSLFEFLHNLRTTGFDAEARPADGCLELSLSPASTADIKARSSGVVRKPETVNYRTYAPCKDGLFCEDIFGPERGSRRQRFGHIELTVPIVPMIWRLGDSPALASALGVDRDQVERLALRDDGIREEDGRIEFCKYHPNTAPIGQPKDKNPARTGVDALRRLLEQADPNNLPPAWQRDVDAAFVQAVYVSPPDLRPLVLLDNGNWATSDLNDLYRQIINRNNRLSKLIQLNAPETIINNEIQMLQRCVDALQANCFLPESAAVFGNSSRRLACAANMCIHSLQGKPRRVEWCGHARVTISADNRAILPPRIYDALRLNPDHPVLLTSENTSAFTAALPQRGTDRLMRLQSEVLKALDLAEGDECIIHRPMTAEAIAEASQLLQGRIDITPQTASRSLDVDDPVELMGGLITGAVWCESIPLTSSRAIMLVGTGNAVIEVADSVPESTTALDATIPISNEADFELRTPTDDEIMSSIDRHRRKSCVFVVEPADTSPPPETGRIDGLPWMPPESVWPVFRGEPVPFIGQFPLELARREGLLPFDVPPNSLLTVFWHHEWWEAPSGYSAPPLLIHESAHLVELQPPQPLKRPSIPCKLTATIQTEMAQWSTLFRTLVWELENANPKAIDDFYQARKDDLLECGERTRVGGWPHWIQEPEEFPFVAQICSEPESNLMFGDSGSLYIFGESSKRLSGLVHSY